MIVDIMSHITKGSLSNMKEGKKNFVKDVHRFALLGVWLDDFPNGGYVVYHNFESYFVVEVESKKHLDPLMIELKEYVLGKFNESFS